MEFYFSSGHLLSYATPEEARSQKAHLHRCMSVDLMNAVNMYVKPDATIFGLNGYMEALEKVFDMLYPIFYQWVFQIFRQSLEINYDTLDWEAFCILHFATMVNDERLRNKIIAMEKPMKENAMKIVVKYVSTKVSSQSIEEQETANVVNTYRFQQETPSSLWWRRILKMEAQLMMWQSFTP